MADDAYWMARCAIFYTAEKRQNSDLVPIDCYGLKITELSFLGKFTLKPEFNLLIQADHFHMLQDVR